MGPGRRWLVVLTIFKIVYSTKICIWIVLVQISRFKWATVSLCSDSSVLIPDSCKKIVAAIHRLIAKEWKCSSYAEITTFPTTIWRQPCKVIFLSLWKTISTSIANFLGGNSELMGFIERWRCVFHTRHRVEAMMKQRQDEGSRQSNQGSYRSELRSLFRAWINEMK